MRHPGIDCFFQHAWAERIPHEAAFLVAANKSRVLQHGQVVRHVHDVHELQHLRDGRDVLRTVRQKTDDLQPLRRGQRDEQFGTASAGEDPSSTQQNLLLECGPLTERRVLIMAQTSRLRVDERA